MFIFMTKKTPPKKKLTPLKTKAAKSIKPAKSVGKVAKISAKAPAPKKKTVVAAEVSPKPAKKMVNDLAKPTLMSKKGKKEAFSDEIQEKEVKKTQTIVSLIEDSPAMEEFEKVEKTGKIKPVKIDRGNLADEKAKWSELYKKFGKEKALVYKMTESYSPLTPLQHKVLGWGYVLTNENDRLEVLFENGIRILISNYKS
jgi:hypothetical protein